jgi:DNA invertase Pin-like site-specific DNA recombinase
VARNAAGTPKYELTVIGYARVSATDQDLSIQEAALRAGGCDVIRAEKRSGNQYPGPRRAPHGAAN